MNSQSKFDSKFLAKNNLSKALLGKEEIKEALYNMIDNLNPVLLICSGDKETKAGLSFHASFFNDEDKKAIDLIVRKAMVRKSKN